VPRRSEEDNVREKKGKRSAKEKEQSKK